jgi:hypothetical protein
MARVKCGTGAIEFRGTRVARLHRSGPQCVPENAMTSSAILQAFRNYSVRFLLEVGSQTCSLFDSEPHVGGGILVEVSSWSWEGA